MTSRDSPRTRPRPRRDRGGRGLKDADRTDGSTFDHYGWKAVYAALNAAGGATHE